MEPHWVPLYGIKGSKGLQEQREKYPHLKLDTCYKCRLLVAFTLEEVSVRLNPRSKSIGPCTDPPKEVYVLRFDLLQASQLDERSIPDNTQVARSRWSWLPLPAWSSWAMRMTPYHLPAIVRWRLAAEYMVLSAGCGRLSTTC